MPLGDEDIFTVSDIIDDSSINVQHMLQHLITVFEQVFRKRVG